MFLLKFYYYSKNILLLTDNFKDFCNNFVFTIKITVI